MLPEYMEGAHAGQHNLILYAVERGRDINASRLSILEQSVKIYYSIVSVFHHLFEKEL